MAHEVAVITFPGSNCDQDVRHAISLTQGLRVRPVWHKETSLGSVDAVVLPGGFSYGDYLRCGAIAQFSPIMGAVRDFAAKGGPVLGICNGFQILTEAGLLPGALIRNTGLKFLCQDVQLEVSGRASAFSRALPRDRALTIPIAHHDGNYVADPETLSRMDDNGQILFRYVGGAPNGSAQDIAGVSNAEGNVVGLMPHPERAVEPALGGTDGRAFFTSLAEWLG